jgi:hypothetical protein
VASDHSVPELNNCKLLNCQRFNAESRSPSDKVGRPNRWEISLPFLSLKISREF